MTEAIAKSVNQAASAANVENASPYIHGGAEPGGARPPSGEGGYQAPCLPVCVSAGPPASPLAPGPSPLFAGRRADFARLRLLAMRQRGVILELRQGKLFARPAGKLTSEDQEVIAADRPIFIRLIGLGACAQCGKQMHANRSCYHCNVRTCEAAGCARRTPSVFIAMCDICGHAAESGEGRVASGEQKMGWECGL